MDLHTRIAAALHIVTGCLGTCSMLLGAVAFNGLGHFIDVQGGQPAVTNFVFGFGTTMALVFALLLAIETVAGIALLKGSRTGRVFVIVFGILQLFNFPFGTFLGIYTLWALLRKQPAPAADVIVT